MFIEWLLTLWPPWLKFFPSISAERVSVSPWNKNVWQKSPLEWYFDKWWWCLDKDDRYLHKLLLISETNLAGVVHFRPHTCLGITNINLREFSWNMLHVLQGIICKVFHSPRCRVQTSSPLQSLCYCWERKLYKLTYQMLSPGSCVPQVYPCFKPRLNLQNITR